MQIRRLKDIQSIYKNVNGCDLDTIIYTIDNIEKPNTSNELSYGFTTIMPGTVNGEYFMTKGHLHAKEENAEVYYGVEGHGIILVGDEERPMSPGVVVYVDPHMKHRAINTGDTPFKFFCVYIADSGHNYNTTFKEIRK